MYAHITEDQSCRVPVGATSLSAALMCPLTLPTTTRQSSLPSCPPLAWAVTRMKRPHPLYHQVIWILKCFQWILSCCQIIFYSSYRWIILIIHMLLFRFIICFLKREHFENVQSWTGAPKRFYEWGSKIKNRRKKLIFFTKG